jgi:hypothetical protein
MKGMHMKRYLTISLIATMFLLAVMPASAQIFGVGVKGGLNFATLRGDFILDDEDFDLDSGLKNKTGLVLGVSFNTRLIPLLSLQPEILYSEKGAKIKESFSFPINGQTISGSFEGTFDLKYLEVPILLRAQLPVPGFSPFLYAGPSVAYNLSADFTVEASAMGFTESESEDIKDQIKDFDVGFVVGGGLEFGLPLLKLHVEARYTMGLSNVVDNNEFDTDLDLKNGVFSLMVGVTF